MFRHKPNTFPSSWSSFIMSVSASCDKDRRQSKSGRSILRGAFSNVLLVYEESEALPVLFTNLFAPSPSLQLLWTNPLRKTEALRMLESFIYLQTTAPFVQCSLRCSEATLTALNYCRLRPLSVEHWLAQGRVVPVWLPWRTAAPMHDRKAESTLKMTLFHQNNNTAKCQSVMEEKAQILKSKRCWALRGIQSILI